MSYSWIPKLWETIIHDQCDQCGMKAGIRSFFETKDYKDVNAWKQTQIPLNIYLDCACEDHRNNCPRRIKLSEFFDAVDHLVHHWSKFGYHYKAYQLSSLVFNYFKCVDMGYKKQRTTNYDKRRFDQVLYSFHVNTIRTAHGCRQWRYCDYLINQFETKYSKSSNLTISTRYKQHSQEFRQLLMYHQVLTAQTETSQMELGQEMVLDNRSHSNLPIDTPPLYALLDQKLTSIKLKYTVFDKNNDYYTAKEIIQYGLVYSFDNDQTSAEKAFDYCFSIANTNNQRYVFKSDNELKGHDRHLHLAYALYLYRHNCFFQACDEFKLCLENKFNLMDAYFYYYYSLCLFEIGNYSLSLYYLRLSKKINGNLYVFDAQTDDKTKQNNESRDTSSRDDHDCNKNRRFGKFLDRLRNKGFDWKKCGNVKCNHTGKNGNKNAKGERKDIQLCKGCKAVTYCSRKCQKADWSKHKKFCLHFATGPLTDEQNCDLRKYLNHLQM